MSEDNVELEALNAIEKMYEDSNVGERKNPFVEISEKLNENLLNSFYAIAAKSVLIKLESYVDNLNFIISSDVIPSFFSIDALNKEKASIENSIDAIKKLIVVKEND